MIKVICDKCGKDCVRVGFEVAVSLIHNPVPLYPTDVGKLQITDDPARIRFILCENCYQKLGLPNIHQVIRGENLFEEDE